MSDQVTYLPAQVSWSFRMDEDIELTRSEIVPVHNGVALGRKRLD